MNVILYSSVLISLQSFVKIFLFKDINFKKFYVRLNNYMQSKKMFRTKSVCLDVVTLYQAKSEQSTSDIIYTLLLARNVSVGKLPASK